MDRWIGVVEGNRERWTVNKEFWDPGRLLVLPLKVISEPCIYGFQKDVAVGWETTDGCFDKNTDNDIDTGQTTSQRPRWMAANAGEDFSRLGQRMATAGEDFSQFDISKEEMEKLVAEVVRYVIFKTHHSSGCPIKREELVQLVTKNYFHRNLPALVINAAKDKLSSVFGYELRELQTSRPSSANLGRPSQNSVADPKSYNLVSQLPPEVYKKYVEDENTAHLTGFMFVIVSIVHLAEGKIPVENLWHHLKRMGLCENEISLPLFGNIKQALETVVQQRRTR